MLHIVIQKLHNNGIETLNSSQSLQVCACVCVRERERKSVCVFCVYSNKLVLKKEAFEFNALQFPPLSLLNEPLHSQQAGTPYWEEGESKIPPSPHLKFKAFFILLSREVGFECFVKSL